MSRKITTQIIIDRFEKIHGDKYDYSEVVYGGSRVKVKIVCKNHGVFSQMPYSHVQGNGCPSCGITTTADTNTCKSAEVVGGFKAVHGDTYDYSLVDYKKATIKVKIICKKHGVFEQKPHVHKSGHGCPACGLKSRLDIRTSTQSCVIDRFEAVHGNMYDYSKVKYTNSRSDVVVICNIHGEFKQSANSHAQGNGCPACGEYGFNPNEPAILYYLEVNNGEAYKIGITNRTVAERFSNKDLSKIKVLKIVEYASGYDARAEELRILKEFSYAKYTGDDLLASGNTELFNRDILLAV